MGGIANLQFQRRAAIKVPDLSGINAVPARGLASFEQEIDRGRISTAGIGVTKCFAEMPAFGMGLR
jgi:hypothetical protein